MLVNKATDIWGGKQGTRASDLHKEWRRQLQNIICPVHKPSPVSVYKPEKNILGKALKELGGLYKNAKNWINWHNARWLDTVGESVSVGRIPTK